MSEILRSTPALVCCFALYFLALWISVLYFLSLISGWHLLAKTFRANAEIVKDITWSGHASMRWGTSYSGALYIGGNCEGLRLAVWVIFRVGNPPLFVPWKQITIQKSPWYALYFSVTLILGSTEHIPFRISKRTARKLSQAAGSGWPDLTNSAQL